MIQMEGRVYSAWRETFTRLYWVYTKHRLLKSLRSDTQVSKANRQMSAADGECKILKKSIPMVSIVRRSVSQYAARCVDALPISGNFLHSVVWLQSLFLFELKFIHFPNPLKLGTLLRYFFTWMGKKFHWSFWDTFVAILRALYFSAKFAKELTALWYAINPISSECELVCYHLLDHLYRNIL